MKKLVFLIFFSLLAAGCIYGMGFVGTFYLDAWWGGPTAILLMAGFVASLVGLVGTGTIMEGDR